MPPKVLSPDDRAAFLAIVRELYDVDQQIEALANERASGVIDGVTLPDRIHKLQRQHLDLRERAKAFGERGDLVEVNLDTFADDFPQAAEQMAIGFVEILGRTIARAQHKAEERVRRQTRPAAEPGPAEDPPLSPV